VTTAPDPRRAGPTLAGALDAAGAAHRRAVASSLGLAADAGAQRIAAAVLEPEGLAARVAALDRRDHETLAFGAFMHGLVAIDHHRHLPEPPTPSPTLLRLASDGLLCATRNRNQTVHQIHPELGVPLRAALLERAAASALACDEAVPKGVRWLTGPEQSLHDAAALSARLAAGDVKVKADGELYANAMPKLAQALPQLGLQLDEPAAALRLDLTLELLRDGGFVRCRGEDRPGAATRRQLVTAGDLLAGLRAGGADLQDLVAATAQRRIGIEIAWLLADLLRDRSPGCELSLAAFAEGCEPLALAVDRSLGGLPSEIAAQLLLAAVWLAGRCAFGVDAEGAIIAVRFDPPDATGETGDGPLALLQPSFELVLRRRPTPGERLVLELLSQGSAGQEHVRMLTRGSVVGAARVMRASGSDPLDELGGLCGEVPQNVRRTLEDWIATVKPPARLRSAIFVELPDEATADRAAAQLKDLVVERIGHTRLAIEADALGTLATRLTAVGVELEPGIDRISGIWRERTSPVDDRATRAWTARDIGSWRTDLSPLQGTIVGILGEVAPRAQAVTSSPLQAVIALELGRPGDVDTLFDASDDLDDLRYVLDEVCGESEAISVRYAAADGAQLVELVPTRVADGRVHGVDARTREPVALWLTSILEVAA